MAHEALYELQDNQQNRSNLSLWSQDTDYVINSHNKRYWRFPINVRGKISVFN